MRLFLTLIFTAFLHLTCSTNKQTEIVDSFSFFTTNNKIDWSKYDQNIPNNDKQIFALQIKDQFAYFFDAMEAGTANTLNDFISKLHFLDLNNDKKIDAIYEGWSGGESDNTQIFINKKGQLVKVFEAFQYLEALDFDKDDKLTSFTILDFGCCADYFEYQTKFIVTDNFTTSVLYRRAKPSFETAPKTVFLTPIKFITLSDEYSLRSAPIIDDTSTIIYDAPNKGNVIAKYPKNSSGLSWAEQKDSKGRIWWLVEMNPVDKLSYDLDYTKDSINSREIGWMSSSYLQK